MALYMMASQISLFHVLDLSTRAGRTAVYMPLGGQEMCLYNTTTTTTPNISCGHDCLRCLVMLTRRLPRNAQREAIARLTLGPSLQLEAGDTTALITLIILTQLHYQLSTYFARPTLLRST